MQTGETKNIIDFNTSLKIFIRNKKTIFLCFLFFTVLGIALNFILPKKYTSEAKILIKKTGSTNLSYINPFVIPENVENNQYSSLIYEKNFLNEEIEIIKSPLVIDNVVKENDLKYKIGPAKGKHLSTKDFLRENFTLTKIKNADIIYVSYKSKSPLLSYNVINSIINNYKAIQEKLNTDKAFEDTKFLKKAYSKTEEELNFKINELKQYKNQPESLINNFSAQNLNLLSFYDKRLKQKLKQISDNETNLKKLEIEISQKTEELNSLRKKLEWSSLVNEISKNTTNIIILQSPEIKEKYDYSEPDSIIIFIFSLFSWILTSFIFIIKKY